MVQYSHSGKARIRQFSLIIVASADIQKVRLFDVLFTSCLRESCKISETTVNKKESPVQSFLNSIQE
jgi:hypothetical protein